MNKMNWPATLVVGVALGVGGFAAAPEVMDQTTKVYDRVVGPGEIKVAAAGAATKQRARFFRSSSAAPLIVDLHYWSMDQRGHSGDDVALDKLAKARGWNYIRPALAGHNNHPGACCSQGVIDGVNSAIAYAKAHGEVSEVYVVGGSGGGYTTLCAAMSTQVKARAFYAWSSITDLEAWHAEHAGDNYGKDVRQCTASKGKALDVAAARRRSPMYMPLPASTAPIYLYAGINDGSGVKGSVVPAHSVRFYNRFAVAHGDEPVSDATMLSMIVDRGGPQTAAGQLVGDRAVHMHRTTGNVSITVFEGGHEILAKPTVTAIEADQAILHPGVRVADVSR